MAAGDLVTATGHLEWRGWLVGTPLTNVTFAGLTGWLDLPAMRGTDADRPGRHGTFPGQKRLSGRTVEVELTVAYPDPDALAALRAATVLDEDPAEEPLVIWDGTPQARLVYARVERRNIPQDWAFSIGHERATVQWVTTDPRQYSVAEQTATIGLPAAGSGGLSFPIAFPLDFGSGVSGGQLTLTNSGDALTWPTFDITGPVAGPVITDTDTGQILQFDPTFEVPAGQTLTVESDARAVTLNGVPRGDKLTVRQWFGLQPGDNHIIFSSAGAFDPAASLTVRWRHSWM